jgi:hypothetical protein
MIFEILKRKPAMLPRMLWVVLRPRSAIRTAEEEQIEVFKDGELCAPPESTFGRAIRRALRACIAMFKQTGHITIHFVQNDISDIDFSFDSNRDTLKIHHKWLDFDTLHRKYSCRDPGNVAIQDAVFFCDHIIEEILRMLSATIFSTTSIPYHGEMEMIRNGFGNTSAGSGSCCTPATLLLGPRVNFLPPRDEQNPP